MSEIISLSALKRLAGDWLAEGRRVVAPVRARPDVVLYQDLANPDALVLEGFVHPANTIKDVVFPRHERLYAYKLHGKQIELVDAEPPSREQIVLGARPCDAAALPILDHVFNWDYEEASYNRRRELTTVVTLACRQHDEHCFCTVVGLGPDDTRGSDAMLYDLGDGTLEVRCRTEKGKALFAGKTEPSNRVGELPPRPESGLDLEAIERFLADGYDSPLWQAASLRCLGCGACAYGCPTCHCFDIVDERDGSGGHRVRNWDACQFGLFTLHASGHNPRSVQAHRQRQRIYHKFRIYREKFGETLCTGCGNCTRNCPVSLGVRPVLEAVMTETLRTPET